jgi:hypothetical protein
MTVISRLQGHVADQVGRPRQQGHMAQSDNDKCQVELAFQVRANHESEWHVVATQLMTHHQVT